MIPTGERGTDRKPPTGGAEPSASRAPGANRRRATLGWVAGIILVIWLVALGIAAQPHDPPKPVILHAGRLDRPAGDLPTLPPLQP